MRPVKKLLALLLSATLVLSVPACSSAPGNSPSSTSGSESTASSGKVVQESERKFYTISMYSALHPSSSLEEIPKDGFYLDKEYEKKFNVKFNIRYVPASNEDEVYNITMASGDIQDVMVGNWNRLHKYANAWWNLNDFIKGKYKYLEEKFFNDPYVYALSAEQDGQIKILNMLSEQYIGDVLMVRGDLVKAWGIDLSKVKTKEDWYDVLKMVKEKDSKIAPYMTRMKTPGVIQRLCEGWSGIKQAEYVDNNNVVRYGAAEPKMREVVEWLRKLYAEKLIDQEYPTTDTAKWQERVLGEGVFLTHDNASSRITWAQTQWANLGVKDKNYVAVPPIQPDKNTLGYTTIHYPKLRGGMAIYTKAEKGKVDRILEMANYNFSPEGNILVNYGIEGVSFKYGANGLIDDIPEYKSAIDANTMPQEKRIKGTFTSMIRLEPNGVYLPSNRKNESVVAAAKMYEDGGLIRRNWLDVIRFTDAEQKEVTRLSADIKTYTDENLDKFIMGVKPMSEWDAFVAGYKKLNLDRHLEIYNTALQRSLKNTKK